MCTHRHHQGGSGGTGFVHPLDAKYDELQADLTTVIAGSAEHGMIQTDLQVWRLALRYPLNQLV